MNANESLRVVKPFLKTAIEGCIDAALDEWSIDAQAKLLKAVSYGSVYTENYDSTKFINACKIIRVLNGLRDRRIGLPITYSKYSYIY